MPLGQLDGQGASTIMPWSSTSVKLINAGVMKSGEGLHNSADIGLDGNVLLVPETGTSTISAYAL